MPATQLPSSVGGNSSDQKPNTANYSYRAPAANSNYYDQFHGAYYDSDEMDEDEMLEALIRSEMGDDTTTK